MTARNDVAYSQSQMVALKRYLSSPPQQRPDRASALAMRALAAIHGPPPGGDSSRKAMHFARATDAVKAQHKKERPRATRVSVEDGPVLWASVKGNSDCGG